MGGYNSKYTGLEIDAGIEAANKALPKAGGTMEGVLTAGGTQDPATSQVRNIYAGTADMEAGVTSLATGALYFVYE